MLNNAVVASFSTFTDPSQASVFMWICTDSYKYKPQSLSRHSQSRYYGNAVGFFLFHTLWPILEDNVVCIYYFLFEILNWNLTFGNM